MKTNLERALEKVSSLLQEAGKTGSWGEITLSLKSGRVIVVNNTIQFKIDEDKPANGNHR
jgi:hypothetical protein